MPSRRCAVPTRGRDLWGTCSSPRAKRCFPLPRSKPLPRRKTGTDGLICCSPARSQGRPGPVGPHGKACGALPATSRRTTSTARSCSSAGFMALRHQPTSCCNDLHESLPSPEVRPARLPQRRSWSDSKRPERQLTLRSFEEVVNGAFRGPCPRCCWCRPGGCGRSRLVYSRPLHACCRNEGRSRQPCGTGRRPRSAVWTPPPSDARPSGPVALPLPLWHLTRLALREHGRQLLPPCSHVVERDLIARLLPIAATQLAWLAASCVGDSP